MVMPFWLRGAVAQAFGRALRVALRAAVGYGRAGRASRASALTAPTGAAALPTMSGPANDGTFCQVRGSTSVTAEPASWMEVSVGPLQSQHAINLFARLMRP